ncbi:MAG: uroporphyrinogen-III C-methyltransferase [Legionella sp.]
MANSTEEQAQKIKKAPSLTPNEKPTPKNNYVVPKSKGLISTFAVIVALIALAVAGYTLYLNQELQKQLTHKDSAFSSQVTQLEQKQDQTQEQINNQMSNTQKTQKQLQTQLEHLGNKLQSALNQRFYQNQDWLLLKARYYLELAQINAHWSTNFDATTTLLEQADQLLKPFNDPKVFNIRQAIAKDIAEIQATPVVDRAGILSQLDASQTSINDRSIALPESEEKTSGTDNETPSNHSSTWNQRLQSSMNLLGKLVVIRRHDQNIKPLLSPMLETVLKERLRLNIQEAQWAVLNHDPFVYQLALKQAITRLKTNFNENMPNNAALIKKLTELQQTNITPKKPTGSSALPLLNELIETKKTPANQSLNNQQGGNQ